MECVGYFFVMNFETFYLIFRKNRYYRVFSFAAPIVTCFGV